MSLNLCGVGHFHPDNVISNQFLEDLDIGTDNNWILERVGIRNRRTALSLDYLRETRNSDVRAAAEAAEFTLAETGARAAEMAIARAGIDRSQIGMVLAGSSAQDTVTPTEAANIAQHLALEVPAIDINSACTSMFANVQLLSMMQPKALPEYVLVVVVEAATRIVDYTDRNSAVLWGDGAAAMVFSTQNLGKAELLYSDLQSSPAGAERIVVPRTGHFRQDGRAVQMFAIRKTLEQLRRLQKKAKRVDDLYFVGHQANLRVLENVCQQAEINQEHHFSNIEEFGNTAAASGLSVLSQNWERWKAGDEVVMAGVGAGLTWGGFLLQFNSDTSA